MSIGIDAQLTLGTPTGIGEYISGLLAAFAAETVPIQALRQPGFDPWRFDRRVLWDQVLLPLAARKCALLHCTAGTAPFIYPRPYVVTVHDTAWLRVQAHARSYARLYFGRMMLATYRRATRIIVVSEFAKTEFLSFVDYPEPQIDVIYNGVATAFAQVQSLPTPEPIILCPGTIERRKNLGFLIRAVGAMNNNARIYAPGPHTPYVEECRAIAESCGMTQRLDMPGYISRPELEIAYARAAIVAIPSTYEGFGYAAAQALCAGVPVIVPPDGALAEIVGAAGTVAPLDAPGTWSRELADYFFDPRALQERAQRARSAAVRQFSWAVAAKKTIAAYHAAIDFA